MNLLIIDTSSSLWQFLLKTKDRKTLSFHFSSQEISNASILTTAVNFIINAAQLEIKDIHLIVGSLGPGSFTGLRVGMSFIKGLSSGWNIPFIFINTLDALAFSQNTNSKILCVLDGRKSKIYAALYKNFEKISPYWDITFENIIDNISLWTKKEDLLLVGNKAEEIKDVCPFSRISVATSPLSTLKGLEILGKKEYLKRGSDPIGMNLFYLRDSDALPHKHSPLNLLNE